MSARDFFGVAVRIIGLLLLVYAVRLTVAPLLLFLEAGGGNMQMILLGGGLPMFLFSVIFIFGAGAITRMFYGPDRS